MSVPFPARLPVRLEARSLGSRLPPLTTGAVVTVATLATFALVQLAGGPPNAWNHLAYAPIALGAYAHGWRGGVLTALFAAVALGPAAFALDLPSRDTVDSVAVRGAAYLAVGALLGVMFERLTQAIGRWQETAARLDRRQRESIVAFARAAEAKDRETGEHIGRVQLLSHRLAIATGMSAAEAEELGWAAMLHDIGKLHVPDSILTKPGPLTPEEWAIMRQHPVWGADILPRGHSFETARMVALWHHENFDGTGYPDGLAGAAIPLDARIVRITDAFDAMTSDRPYARARSIEQALEELDRHAGTHFDPELVRVMVDLVRRDGDLVAQLDRLLRPGHAAAPTTGGWLGPREPVTRGV